MTDAEEARILEHVLAWETAKYTNRKTDRGGPTKYGITWRTLAKWRGRPVTEDDVRNLTYDEALRIYKAWYVRGPGFTLLKDAQLANMLVHWGVMSGPRAAVQGLQRVVGVRVDGILGPITARAANTMKGDIRNAVKVEWWDFLDNIVENLPEQAVHLNGWRNRVRDVSK